MLPLDPLPGEQRPAGPQRSTRVSICRHRTTISSHPKAVVRRPTCPLGPRPPAPAGPGQDPRSQGEGWRAHPAQCPAPSLAAGLLCRPGPPTCEPNGQLVPGNSLAVKVSLRPDEMPKETRVGKRWSRLQHPYPTPVQRGPPLRPRPVMPARGTQRGRHASPSGCPFTGALRRRQWEPFGREAGGPRSGLLLWWPQSSGRQASVLRHQGREMPRPGRPTPTPRAQHGAGSQLDSGCCLRA